MADRSEQLNPRRRWAVIALIVLLCAGGIMFGLRKRTPMPDQAATAVAQIQPLEEAVTLVGTIGAGDTMQIVAPFDTTIRALPIKMGQTVEAGQTLVSFDTADLVQHAREAEAAELKAAQTFHGITNWTGGLDAARAARSRAAAQATMDDDQRKLEETQRLYKDGIIPRSELDGMNQQMRGDRAALQSSSDEWRALAEQASPDNRRVAELDYRNAVERANAARRQLAQATLTAPRAGTLIRSQGKDPSHPTDLTVGAGVTRGQALFAIADRSRLNVIAKIDESDANRIEEGQPIEVSGPGFPTPLHGRIVTISGEATPESQGGMASFSVLGELDPVPPETRRLIRLGMTANIRVVTASRPQALVVPTSAIRGAVPDTSVMVLDARGQGHTRAIRIGLTTEQGVEIVGGLKADETVLLQQTPAPSP